MRKPQTVASDQFDERFVIGVGVSSVLILAAKALSIPTLALIRGIDFRIGFIWGVLPTFDLQASHSQYRSIVLWSTLVCVAVAIARLAYGLTFRNRLGGVRMLAAAAALPMVATLVIIEWSNVVAGDRLIDTASMWRILSVLAGCVFISLGVVYGGPKDRSDARTTKIASAAA